MKKLSIIAIALLSIFVSGCSNSNNINESSKPQDTKQASEVNNEEYIIDPSDFYSAEPNSLESDIEELTQDEQKWLIHMREEEKLARDVYKTLGETWQMNIFINIASSEQTHTDSIKTLLEHYGVEDPVTNDTVGEFTLPEIQNLHDDLVAQGSKSLSEALIVGATIEDLDIYDLDVAMSETNKTDINTVYANLQKGSRNHMRAFIKQINRQGAMYAPQYISEEAYNSIISSSQERGRMQ